MSNDRRPQQPPQQQQPPSRELPRARAEYLAEQYGYTPEQINVVRNAICVGANDAELEFFLATCKRVQLDPFARQIWFVKRRQKVEDSQGSEAWIDVGKPETSIDGLRTIAERTGEYEGQAPIQWCGPDAKWVDVWLKDVPPAAARATIFRRGFREPMISVAIFNEFCPKYKTGGTPAMWSKMGANQIAKCAESAAFRRAFPRDLSGMTTDTEMEHVAVSSGYGAPEAKPAKELTPTPAKAAPQIEERKPDVIDAAVTEIVEKSADAKVMGDEEIDRAMITLADELTNATDRAGLARVGAICSQAKGRGDAYSVAVLEHVTPILNKRWRELVPEPTKGTRR